jgi:hypothetical protein
MILRLDKIWRECSKDDFADRKDTMVHSVQVVVQDLRPLRLTPGKYHFSMVPFQLPMVP